MAFQTAAGAALSASAAAPATFNSAGYAALTFTAVGEVESLGEFGKEFNLVTFLPLAERGASKLKGSFNNGSFEPSLALDPDDAGQVIMETALDSDLPISFKLALASGDLWYFQGLVMRWRPAIQTVDDVVMVNSMIELTREDIIFVAGA